MVPPAGLEPARLSTLASKASVSTNSTIEALMVGSEGFEPSQQNATDLQSAPTLQLRRLPK